MNNIDREKIIFILGNLKQSEKTLILMQRIQDMNDIEFEQFCEENKIYTMSDALNHLNGIIQFSPFNNVVTLSELDNNHAFFHFTNIEHIDSIAYNGINAKIGERSEGLEKDAMFFFTEGYENELNLCDVWAKWIMHRTYGEKNQFGVYNDVDEVKRSKLINEWRESFLNRDYKNDTEKKEFIFSLMYEGMLERTLLSLNLKEGVDFSRDAIDVKKQEAFDRLKDGDKSNFKFLEVMYEKHSDLTSSTVDGWNMQSLPNRSVLPSNISQIVSNDGYTDMLHVIIDMHQDYKKNMNSKPEYFDLLNEFVEYASKRLIIEQEKNKKGKNGYEDCMQDDGVKVSTTQKATRVVKEAALDRDENSREENDIGE